jgi:hypothetical protein
MNSGLLRHVHHVCILRRQADRQSLAKVGAQVFVGSLVEANRNSKVPGLRWNSLRPDAVQLNAEVGDALPIGGDLCVGAGIHRTHTASFFPRFFIPSRVFFSFDFSGCAL